MAQRRSTLIVFLDSSVLFSAVASNTGGSAKLFTLKKIKLVVNNLVLTEVERNVRLKLQSYHLERFFKLVEKLSILEELPTLKQINQAKKVIVAKDAPILASAKLSQCNYLLTLDLKHFFVEEVKEFMDPTQILTPKMFLEELKKSV